MYMPADDSPDFENPPAGNHLAVCYRVIDLGTQETSYMGQTKHRHQVLISWELPQETMDDGRPFTIGQKYTLSSSEKSNLRKHLESWRGKRFTDEDLGPGGFDIRNIIGKGCMLQIVHNEKGDRVYANIASVASMPKGLDVPTLKNPEIYVGLTSDRWSVDDFEKLSDNLKAKIQASPEYKELLNGGDPGPNPDDYQYDDEVPF